MTLICPKCQSRLQLDDTKTPSGPFTIQCPKCQTVVKLQPPGANEISSNSASNDALSGLNTGRQLAPRFTASSDGPAAAVKDHRAAGDLSEVAKLLVEALRNANEASGAPSERRRHARKVLVCAGPAYRDEAARMLVENKYEVLVAQNAAQALGSMHEDQIDVLLLDANFDPVEQGTAFVMRAVKLLRPARRRRLFLIHVSPSIKTLDMHAAFLHNVNLAFNPADMDKLPDVLEMSLRNYNELYRDFFNALNVQPI